LSVVAVAAFHLGDAVGILTDEFALGLRAGLGFVALPVALGVFAHYFADGNWCLAVSHTLRFLANGHALGAVGSCTCLVWALDVADWFLALHVADRVGGLLASGVALWSLTNGFTDRWALRVITLPATLRMALGFPELDGSCSQRKSD